ncbi:protein of unknown function [Caballeronia sp. S22]
MIVSRHRHRFRCCDAQTAGNGRENPFGVWRGSNRRTALEGAANALKSNIHYLPIIFILSLRLNIDQMRLGNAA